jgi:hypothetical protein
LITGDFEARAALTMGDLEILGGSHVHEWLVGFGNDYSALIVGNVSARLFVPEYHFFDIGGDAHFERVLGEQASDRVPDHLANRTIPVAPADYRILLVPEVLVADGLSREQAEQEEAEGNEVEWRLDMDALLARLRTGGAVFR